MRESRFAEEQIIAILKEAEAGAKAEELCRRHWRQRADPLPLKVEARRDGSQRGQAPSPSRGGEPPPEADGRGPQNGLSLSPTLPPEP